MRWSPKSPNHRSERYLRYPSHSFPLYELTRVLVPSVDSVDEWINKWGSLCQATVPLRFAAPGYYKLIYICMIMTNRDWWFLKSFWCLATNQSLEEANFEWGTNEITVMTNMGCHISMHGHSDFYLLWFLFFVLFCFSPEKSFRGPMQVCIHTIIVLWNTLFFRQVILPTLAPLGSPFGMMEFWFEQYQSSIATVQIRKLIPEKLLVWS